MGAKLKLTRGDVVGFGFLTVAVLFVFLFEMLVAKPYLDQHNYRFVWAHICMACLIVFNLYASLFYLLHTDTSTVGLVMPSTLMPEWRYCLVCEANSPPRSYHCKNCDRCVLRRDHHCIFSACCVGFKNHKYYMSLLFQVMLGGAYGFAFHTPYIWHNLGGLTLMTFFTHCIPIPFFVLGYIDAWTAMCNFISMLTIVGSLFAGGLFLYHTNLLLNNQTTHERQNDVTKYKLKSWSQNLNETLGVGWPLTVFLSPLINSKQTGDGISFEATKEDRYTR